MEDARLEVADGVQEFLECAQAQAARAYGAGERYGSGESYGSGERYGAGAGAPHGTAQTPASNGRTGSEAPVNARQGGGS